MTLALNVPDQHSPAGPSATPAPAVKDDAGPSASLSGLARAASGGTPEPARVPDATDVLALHAAMHAIDGFEAGASAFATALARRLGAVRVSVGMVRGSYAEVRAVSGTLDLAGDGEFARRGGAAMDEAIAQGVVLAYPGGPEERPRITLAQQELARHGAGAVLTLPLVSAARAVGALCIETRDPLPAAIARWCEDMACVLAPALALKERAGQGPGRRLAEAWRAMATRHGRPVQLAGVAASLALLVAVALLCTWPVAYRVSAPARLEGIVQRALVAPADGFLHAVHVKPGDTVAAGQVLAELADQELDLQRRKWTAELAQHENSARAALARGERTQYVISQGKADEARAQLELVEQQMARGRIRAPFDGVLIKGDLSQTLGAPVQRGDLLLTVAPAQGFRLIVEVDERDIADVRMGARGAVALAAAPGDTGAFRVVRVTPVATNRDGRNFYEVEGRLEGDAAGLRPGLLGVGKIESADRPLAWIWGHRVLDWLRLAVWSLGA